MARDTSHYLPSLDGLRAISIGLVILSHLPRSVGFPDAWVEGVKYFAPGYLGVRIFFVISGFLITYLLLKEREKNGRISLKNFYIRRILRIFPVYYAFILAIFIYDKLTSIQYSTGDYLVSALYIKNFFETPWLLGHLWSLCVEEQFYLIWPAALVFLGRKHRIGFVFALIILAPFARAGFYLMEKPELVRFAFFTNMDCLMIGCLSAFIMQNYESLALRVCSWTPWAGRLLALITIFGMRVLEKERVMPVVTLLLTPTVQSIAAAYIILSFILVQRGWSYAVLNTRPFMFIGVLSYSLYIWQQPFMARMGELGETHPIFMQYPYNVASLFAMACLSYFAFEKPLLGLRRHFR